jgi:hypothetical protein
LLVADQPEAFVIDAYHQLWHIEQAFRMSKHDLQAWLIYHHLRDSIEAQTGWSIEKFVHTARRYRTDRAR